MTDPKLMGERSQNTIVIVNNSTVLTDDQIKAVIPAFQAQVTDDFLPMWGIGAKVFFGGDNAAVGEWPLYVYDHTDTPGAGGYHVDERGRVSGKVFAADAMAAGEEWTVDLTHELMEMLRDPSAGTDPSAMIRLLDGTMCLPEVCDACEADDYAYIKEIPQPDGSTLQVLVSDFVLPQYFFGKWVNGPYWTKGDLETGSIKACDFMGHLTSGPAPALLPGGYLGIFDPRTGEWGDKSLFDKAGKHSRRSNRNGRLAYRAGLRS